ncbi:beta-propeller fold lactonase family protein [Variovorax sp. J2P1-59]|uniref:lactonase family protein n=1 Tax=Variovorax flavidus TaxID=3053501 RepID=UPI0025750EDE|nr:beta-propeller fold lactonase family protein [Variovorax sp. J2P1-59]MDM0078948.1 beta-propeller fold lactonase family protein [Variovorax sp. J2P1-59]
MTRPRTLFARAKSACAFAAASSNFSLSAHKSLAKVLAGVLVGAVLSACGGGHSSSTSPTGTTQAKASHAISGTVSGLTGKGLVLQNNAGDDIAVSADGSFSFVNKLDAGASYTVSVKTQPTEPTQVCSVNKGSGILGDAGITDVSVVCSTSAFAVGGSVAGLQGSGLVLQNNAGDDIPMSTSGRFVFGVPVASGAGYAVTVKTQPSSPAQTCSVSQGTGTMGSNIVDSVAVVCALDSFKVGGTVSGLIGANTITLLNNGGDQFVVPANGTFEFPASIARGGSYAVAVHTLPSSPMQNCSVSNGSGTVASAPVTNVAVVCDAPTFAVGGTLSGLDGTGLVLQNNGGDDLAVNADGSFTFTNQVATGAAFNVTVKNQPKALDQTCTVTNGSRTMGTSAVTDISGSCVTGFAKMAFVGTNSGGTVTAYLANGNGLLSGMIGAQAAFPGVNTLAVNEAMQRLYVITDVGVQNLSIGAGGASFGSGGADVMVPAGINLAKMDPLGRFLVLLNGSTGELRIHPIQPDGQLNPTASFSASVNGSPQASMVFDPSGRFLYVANSVSNTITAFTLSADGLTSVADTNFATDAMPIGLAFHPSGKFLYAVNQIGGTVSKFTVNPLTGGLSGRVDEPGVSDATIVAMHPRGKWLYAITGSATTSRIYTFTIDSVTGAVNEVGSRLPMASNPITAFYVDPGGLYVSLVTTEGLEQKRVDQSTGTVSGSLALWSIYGSLPSALDFTR